jgi:hypothetical protein
MQVVLPNFLKLDFKHCACKVLDIGIVLLVWINSAWARKYGNIKNCSSHPV